MREPVDIRRVARGVGWGVAGLAFVLMAMSRSSSLVWIGGGVAFLAVVYSVILRLRSIPIANLAAGQTGYQTALPASYIPSTVGATVLALLLTISLLLSVIITKTLEIARESFWALGVFPLVPLLFLFLLMWGFCGLALYLELSKRVLSLRICGGWLEVRLPFGRQKLGLEGLRVWRRTGPDGQTPIFLELDTGPERVTLAGPTGFRHQRRFLHQFEDWLRAKGVPVKDITPVLPVSPIGWTADLAIQVFSFLICTLLSAGLFIVTGFWIQWALGSGTPSLDYYFMEGWVGLAAGGLIWVSPLGKALGELLRGEWLKRRPPACGRRVLVTEDYPEQGLTLSCARSGVVSEDEGMLSLQTPGRRFQIRKDAILTIEPVRGLSARLVCGNRRLISRPLRIIWRGGDNSDQIIHSVLVAANEEGWPNQNLRADGRLYGLLAGWWNGQAPWPAVQNSPVWPRTFGALAFLLAGLVLLPMHNHLLLSRVRTGRWLPPPHAAKKLVPCPLTLEALTPEAMPLIEYRDQSPENASMTGISPLYYTSPFEQRVQPKLSGWKWITGTISHPGGQPHIFTTGDDDVALGLYLFPPRPRLALPPQVTSLATGRAVDLTCLNQLDCGFAKALYGGEKLFFACRAGWKDGVNVREYGWVDVPHDRLHRLGEFAETFASEGSGQPVFFPGGRYVLYRWNVFDLESGGRIPAPPPRLERGWQAAEDDLEAPTRMTFTRGPRLCIYRRVYGDEQWRSEVLEADPATGDIRVVASFPSEVVLLSADGDRWLMRECLKDSEGRVKEFIVRLFDAQTQQSRELLRTTEANLYFLVHGTDRILSYSAKGGWSEFSVAGATATE